MKKTALILSTALVASFVSAESVLKPFNDKGYGTISGRIRSLTMYRDFNNVGNGANSTLGGIIGYTSPEFSGFDAGVAYNYAGEIYDNNLSTLTANPELSILNEAWGRYNFGALDLTNTSVIVGRKINNAEIFRADDIRQKSRSIMAVQAESTDLLETWTLAGGHAFEQSSWNEDDFNDLGDGVTWIESIFSGVEDLELALFNAVAWDNANMLGTRAKYVLNENTSLLGYARKEFTMGNGLDHDDTVLGISAVQKVGSVNLEGGYLGILGDDALVFSQRTVGFNHALGASMLIRGGQWAPGAHSFYLKATTKLESKTILYALASVTMNNKTLSVGDGYELDFVAKQPLMENLTLALKGAFGENDLQGSAVDGRIFLTYDF